jgi:hypothetical protein
MGMPYLFGAIYFRIAAAPGPVSPAFSRLVIGGCGKICMTSFTIRILDWLPSKGILVISSRNLFETGILPDSLDVVRCQIQWPLGSKLVVVPLRIGMLDDDLFAWYVAAAVDL